MPATPGSFGSLGSPIIKIRVGGALTGREREFAAIVDTGFTGFVSISLVDAFPLGLILFGTTSVVLADNSTQVKLTALGLVSLDTGEQAAGIVILEEQQGDVLVGMEFLKSLNKGLLLSPHLDLAELIDDPVPPPPSAPADAAAHLAAALADDVASADGSAPDAPAAEQPTPPSPEAQA